MAIESKSLIENIAHIGRVSRVARLFGVGKVAIVSAFAGGTYYAYDRFHDLLEYIVDLVQTNVAAVQDFPVVGYLSFANGILPLAELVQFSGVAIAVLMIRFGIVLSMAGIRWFVTMIRSLPFT